MRPYNRQEMMDTNSNLVFPMFSINLRHVCRKLTPDLIMEKLSKTVFRQMGTRPQILSMLMPVKAVQGPVFSYKWLEVKETQDPSQTYSIVCTLWVMTGHLKSF